MTALVVGKQEMRSSKTNDTKINAASVSDGQATGQETAKVISITDAPSVKATAKVVNFLVARSEMRKAA